MEKLNKYPILVPVLLLAFFIIAGTLENLLG